MTVAALEVRGLVRRFGTFTAVDDVSFKVLPGEVCGFIGPNGAGKTTAMRICATLDMPDEGDVFVAGSSVLSAPREARRRFGFMPDAYGAYSNTTVADYLDFFARAYGLRGAERRSAVDRLVDFTSLTDLLGKQTSALSKGMKQRLILAKTLIHDPDVLILDEPAAGLDPRARIELRELIKALGAQGKAVLVSSHILPELGEMCDSVVVIESGRVRAAGRVDEIVRALSSDRTRVFLRALVDAETLERAVLEEPGVERTALERGGVVFDFLGGEAELSELLASLVRRGLRPVEISPERAGLEDLFMSLTEGQVQ